MFKVRGLIIYLLSISDKNSRQKYGKYILKKVFKVISLMSSVCSLINRHNSLMQCKELNSPIKNRSGIGPGTVLKTETIYI